MYLTNDDKYVIVWLLVAMPWYCIITSQTVVVVNGDSSMVDGRWAALRGDRRHFLEICQPKNNRGVGMVSARNAGPNGCVHHHDVNM